MNEPEPMSRAQVEACLQRAGLSLTAAQVDEIHRVSGYIRQVLDRLGTDRPMAAEPALIFRCPTP